MSSSETEGHEPVDTQTIVDALLSHSDQEILEISKRAHPGDIEQAFERLDEEEREEVLSRIPVDVLSEWADYLPPSDVEHRLQDLSEKGKKEVLESFADDELVDFLQEVEEVDRPQYIDLLPDEKRQISEDLLQYPEHTAGGRMTMAMAMVEESLTVKQALDELEPVREDIEVLSRIYVVNKDGKLIGNIRLRDLAFNAWNTPIESLLDSDHFSIQAHEDQEAAAQMMSRYDLMTLPVIDEEEQLLGVITYDDALEILEEESTEDMEKISGIGGERELAYLQTPALVHFRRRFGWVLILAFLALISGWVWLKYESIMKAYFILALYLPMVVAAGGNTGAQSATMVIRAMSLGELGPRQFWRVVWKEFQVGLGLGAVLGICVALQVRFLLPAEWVPIPDDVGALQIAMVVGLALTGQIVTSTLIGGSLPILARMLKLDPAVVASPAITTIVDVSGSIIYFSLAQLLF